MLDLRAETILKFKTNIGSDKKEAIPFVSEDTLFQGTRLQKYMHVCLKTALTCNGGFHMNAFARYYQMEINTIRLFTEDKLSLLNLGMLCK